MNCYVYRITSYVLLSLSFTSPSIVLSSEIVEGTEGRLLTGVPYKIENKWHRDQGKPSSLDAESDDPNGRVYRSHFDSLNTYWYIRSAGNGSYRLENQWHQDQGKPSYLDADSDHPNGRIYRSNFDSINTWWYFTPQDERKPRPKGGTTIKVSTTIEG